MEVQTKLATGYWVRKLILTVLFFGFGVLALYDGYVKYPAQAERYAAFQRFQELELARDESPTGLTVTQRNELAQLGETWNFDDPNLKIVERNQLEIQLQRLLAFICFPIALAILATWLLSARRKFAYHEDGTLEAPEGTFPPGRMTGLDKSRWQSKSIAVLEIDGGPKAGGQGVRLDAWIYQGMEEIIDDLDRRLHPEEYEKHDAEKGETATVASTDEASEPGGDARMARVESSGSRDAEAESDQDADTNIDRSTGEPEATDDRRPTDELSSEDDETSRPAGH